MAISVCRVRRIDLPPLSFTGKRRDGRIPVVGDSETVAALRRMKLAVTAILADQQFRMASLFDDAAVLHHDDAVGIGDSREPMCNDQRRAAFRQIGERLLDGALRFGIECGSRLIENQDRRVLRKMRAMARRCFWPPESFTPRSPMTVSKPEGSAAMTLSSRARRAASTISASVASRRP